MLRVTIRTPADPEIVREFESVEAVTFGRALTNDIVLESTYISRSHGEFARDGEGWAVKNRGSRTGITLIRGEQRSEIPYGTTVHLRDGDVLQILHTRLGIELKPEPAVATDFGLSFVSDDGVEDAALAATEVRNIAPIQARVHSDSDKLEVLLELARDLNALGALEPVLRRVSESVFRAIPAATHFSVSVPTKAHGFAPCFASHRSGAPVHDISVSASRLRRVVEGEVAMLFHSSDTESTASESVLRANIAASMAVPIRGSRGVIGVIQIDNREDTVAFDSANLDLAVLLASSAAAALERAQFQNDIAQLFEGFVGASITAIEARDPTTSGHSKRVADYSVALADAIHRSRHPDLVDIHFTDAQRREIRYAALLHDFGKVGVRECVLVKECRLYPEQRTRIADRFALIRALSMNSLLQGAVSGIVDLPPDTDSAAWIEENMGPMRSAIARANRLIDEMNEADAISEEQVHEIERIAAKTYFTEDGEKHAWLEPEELESLLTIHGTLTPEQRAEIEEHVTHSYNVLVKIPWPSDLTNVPRIVHAHHERLDGSGYPLGLTTERIPTQSKLITVVDIFDALTAADRPYRDAVDVERGIELLARDADAGRIDRAMFETFVEARVWEAATR